MTSFLVYWTVGILVGTTVGWFNDHALVAFAACSGMGMAQFLIGLALGALEEEEP